MKRILFDARPLVEQTGGVPRVAARVLEYVRATMPEVEVTLVTTGSVKPDLTGYGLAHAHVRIPNKIWSLWCLGRLTSLDRVGRMPPRLSSFARGAPTELILPNVGFVGTPRIPYTIVVHDLSFLIEPRWFPWKMRVWHRLTRASWLIRNATRVWCVSETTARDVMRLLNVPRERIEVLPQHIIVGATHASPRPGNHAIVDTLEHTIDPPYVLAFGGHPRKNVATAITTVEHLRQDDRFKNLKLIIIGPPTTLRPYDPTSFIEHRTPSDPELSALYQHASALLYPSWYEGFGLPLHEAANDGIPILASAHGALPETAPEGSFLIPPAKPHLWVPLLKEALLKKAQQSHFI